MGPEDQHGAAEADSIAEEFENKTGRKLTPCEERGWKVGDEFKLIREGGHGFKLGTAVTLFRDDGSDMPVFRDRNKRTRYIDLARVTPFVQSAGDESEPEAEDVADFERVAAEQDRMEEEAEDDAMIAQYGESPVQTAQKAVSSEELAQAVETVRESLRELHEGVGTQAHYMECAIQPIDFIVENGLDFLEGNVIKYVARYKRKNGLEDLQKAQQYLTWLIEREERGGAGA